MPPQDSFEDIMGRLRAGDQSAATQLFALFVRRIRGLARARLDERLRSKVDPEDVVQSVYRTFFRRHAAGEFDLTGWDELWSLLTVLTVRKCGRWRNHFHTAGRDVRTEVSAESYESTGGLPPEWLARSPDPTESMELAEMMDALLDGLEERDQAIVSLRLQGCQPGEITIVLGRSLRTVHRVLAQTKERLQRLLAADEEPPER